MKKPTNIIILTYFSFDDALIQTYTLPYVKIIADQLPKNSQIYLQTLEKSKNIPKQQILNYPNIHHLPYTYYPFSIKSMWMMFGMIVSLVFLIFQRNISFIHGWCTPGGALAYILSVITTKKLILDSFEPHAETMVEGKTWSKKSLAFRILFFLEKQQLKRASQVICAVKSMENYAFKTYGVRKKHYFAKPACVDLTLFSERNIKKQELLQSLDLQGYIVCVYAGKFGGIYLEDETFHFLKLASDYFDNRFKFLLLTSHSDEEIESYFFKWNIPITILVKKFIPHHLIPDYMGLGDFALCPVKPVLTKRYSTPIKNGEYWALGLPVLIPQGISDDSEIIEKNNIGFVWKNLSEEEFKKSLAWIDEYLKTYTRREIYDKIRPIAEKYRNFSIAHDVYRQIYAESPKK